MKLIGRKLIICLRAVRYNLLGTRIGLVILTGCRYLIEIKIDGSLEVLLSNCPIL